MKKTLLSLGVAAALGAASMSASAIPAFSLGGYTGAIQIKYQNYESFDGALEKGTENYGVVKLSSILTAGGTTLWSDGQDGAEITGVFNGIIIDTVTASGGQFIINSTGGLLNLYINAAGSFAAAGTGGFTQGAVAGYTNAGCAVATLCYNGITNVLGGGLFLSTAWTAVGVVGDATTTVSGTFNSTTYPLTGTAQGYLDVTGGAYAYNFDTNGKLGGSDMFNQNSFCTPGNGDSCDPIESAGGAPEDGGWALSSNDPVRASYRVPEPGTLALAGLGLLGLGFGKRRRQS